MKSLLANRFVLAVLVFVAVGAIFELAGVTRPASFAQGSLPHQARRTAVTTALRGCPGPGSTGATSSGLAIATAPALAGTGQAKVIPLSAGEGAQPAPVHTDSQPGRLALLTVPKAPAVAHRARKSKTAGPAGTTKPAKKTRKTKKKAKKQAAGPPSAITVPTTLGRGGVIVQSAGSMAQGLEVEQTGAGRLAAARCGAPGTDFWFVGPGGRPVHEIQLYLMNVGSQPAEAQVNALTEGVPLLAGSDIGITIPPHGMVVQSLAGLLHGSSVAALHVSTSAGLIVAALRETRKSTQPGAWLPATAPPSTRLVLPSLPGTSGTRELYVGVPGTQDAQVKLTAVTARGSYQPTGGSGIALPGGSAVGIALPSLSGIPAAIVLTSNVPVTAAMMVPGGALGAPGAFTAAAGPVQQQGVIADNPAGQTGSAELVLSAPHAAASVRVTVTGPKSPISTTAGPVVRIAAGHSVALRLHPPRTTARTSAFSVVITPLAGSGPVYAGRVITVRGVVDVILPVLSSPTWIALPQVRASLTAVLPRPPAVP